MVLVQLVGDGVGAGEDGGEEQGDPEEGDARLPHLRRDVIGPSH